MADSKARLIELAQRIQSNAQDIIERLNQMPDEPVVSPATFLARSQILNALAELEPVVAGPQVYLTRLAGPGNMILLALQAMHRLQIPSKIAPTEVISYEELAKRCGHNLRASDLEQLMRVAIANYVFTEPRNGFVQHNAASEALIDPLFNQWIGHLTEEIFPASARGLDAILKWPGSQELEETGSFLSHGNKGYWEGMDSFRQQRFSDAMKYMGTLGHMSYDLLLKNLAWTDDTSPSLLVDLGGSTGSVAIKLLNAFPRLNCVVQDFEPVVASAEVPPALAGRLSFQAHDFFTEQPVKDADVYFMRSIMHDWSDKYAIQILKNLVPALKPGAKVICNEICLPEPSQQLPPTMARILRGTDMTMKVHFNSKERDPSDWKSLFERASPNFEFSRIANMPGSGLAVIEFTWKG